MKLQFRRYNSSTTERLLHMLRSNHLVQTVRTTFPVMQTVPFTFPLGISHLHLWRSGDGFSDSVCTAGKKMASLHRKPYIIAFQLQLCTGRDSSYTRAGGGVTREKGARSMGEEKKKGKIIIIIINKKLTGKINNYEEKRGKQKNKYK